MPAWVYQEAWDTALHHVQVKVLSVKAPAKTPGDCSVTGEVVRIFRDKSATLKIGTRLEFMVSCARRSDPPLIGGTLWADYDQMMNAKYLEVFLNKNDGRYEVALWQSRIIEAPTDRILACVGIPIYKRCTMKSARLLNVCGAATLIVLCLTSLAVAQQSASEEDKKKAWEGYASYQVGLQALKGARYSEAVDKLTTAIRDGYRGAEVYNSRGLAYDALGEYERAITDYTQAISLNPSFAEAYGNRGLAHLHRGLSQGGILTERIENAEAQRDFDRCFQLNPGLKPQFDRLAGEIRSRAPQQSPQPPTGCPTGAEWRRLEPDPDLRAWPIVRDIGDANRLSALQRVMQARLCENAGESERAANYYYEAHELLIEAIPREQLDDLLARSTALRAKAPESSAASSPIGEFSFDAMHIQLSTEEGSPAVSRVQDGQDYHIVFIVRYLRQGQLELRYTIRSREEGELGHDSDSIDISFSKGTATKMFGIHINFPEGAKEREKTFEIIGTVTMNGVTQSRQTSLTVYR